MKTNEQLAIEQWLSKAYPHSGACGCMGPAPGDPVCPCKMAWVSIVDNRFYMISEQRSSAGVTHTATEIFL